MSFVIATTELVQGAATKLAAIGASLADASAAVSGPTTAIAAAAQDEVSVAIASLFANFGREFQTLNGQAQAFHSQFVNLLNSSAGAYLSAEAANAQAVDIVNTTAANAQQSLAAIPASLRTLAGGASTGLSQLVTNPAAFVGNLQNAAQSVFLVGAPPDVAWAVVQRTLGGVTQATNGSVDPPEVVPINDFHAQLYYGLAGLGDFQTGSPVESAFVTGLTNLASSPASGVLLGALGPFVSPGVALWNSAGSVFADLTNGNVTGAFGHLIDTPVNVVDAFFNGATLNLDALAPTFDPFVTAGSDGGERLDGLSFAFGGLFSPGQVVTGANGPLYYGTGGSILNALGLDLSFYPPDDFAGGSLSAPGIPVGPIGATAGLLSILGHALGGSLLS
ncbi:outer membrane porin GjpA [Mycobacterium bourgelatii]|uniref:PE domain-containing protein n=1 Tax=Mycobacterium bourgelatii TaxID=1273442 RepID=A0A7I9YRB1_MYCBU|nr:outer membrane porin GjpA [Mycobacterium bourgelatii]MCV6974340.1 PE family protein [Mycobacterium bourgelatii]GFG91198.1 hypothetical protein MBOU_32400 [Mycobacterium bourgelatii]